MEINFILFQENVYLKILTLFQFKAKNIQKAGRIWSKRVRAKTERRHQKNERKEMGWCEALQTGGWEMGRKGVERGYRQKSGG